MSAPNMSESGTAVIVEDAGFLAFAQIHLRAAEHNSFAIGDGYATYAAFIRRRGAAPLSRASFGAMVAALAELEPDDLSPREALEALYRLKALSRGTGPGRL